MRPRQAPATAPVRWEANLLNEDLRADPDIAVTDELDSADVAVITDGLRAYDLNQTGYHDFRPLAVLVRDPQTGKVIGGLHGRSEFGLVYVAWFFLKIGAAHGLAAAYWRWRKKRADDAAALGSR
jgi:hypothetical protein